MSRFPFDEYRFLAATIETVSDTLHKSLIANGYELMNNKDLPREKTMDSYYLHCTFPGGTAQAAARLKQHWARLQG